MNNRVAVVLMMFVLVAMAALAVKLSPPASPPRVATATPICVELLLVRSGEDDSDGRPWRAVVSAGGVKFLVREESNEQMIAAIASAVERLQKMGFVADEPATLITAPAMNTGDVLAIDARLTQLTLQPVRMRTTLRSPSRMPTLSSASKDE